MMHKQIKCKPIRNCVESGSSSSLRYDAHQPIQAHHFESIEFHPTMLQYNHNLGIHILEHNEKTNLSHLCIVFFFW